MDFVKYVSLLSTGKLYFCGPAGFDDPFEGATGIKAEEAAWEKITKNSIRERLSSTPPYKDYTPEHMEEVVELNYAFSRVGAIIAKKIHYISCWHANESESEAMWKLYSKDNTNAIAVRTNYKRLNEALEKNTSIAIGYLNYVDYRNISPAPNYILWYKRKSYEHEKEVRAIYRNPNLPDSQEVISPNYKPEAGLLLPIDLNVLIEKVYISPLAGDWLRTLVEDVSLKYGFSVEVHKSDLAQIPYQYIIDRPRLDKQLTDPMRLQLGDFVELNGLPCVVIGLPSDTTPVPEGHVAVWFGAVMADTTIPEVWTVPAEYLLPGQAPIVLH